MVVIPIITLSIRLNEYRIPAGGRFLLHQKY